MRVLPHNPSEVIAIAINALVERRFDRHYIIDMQSEHSGGIIGPCRIGLAGAVMSYYLGAGRWLAKRPHDYKHNDTFVRLVFLNTIASGMIGNEFIDNLLIDMKAWLPDVSDQWHEHAGKAYVSYHVDPSRFILFLRLAHIFFQHRNL